MINRRTRTLTLALLVAAWAPAAQALNPLFLSVKAGESALDGGLDEGLGSVIDGEDSSFGAGLGVSLGRYLAVQGEYQDLGTVTVPGSSLGSSLGSIQADSTLTSLSLVPHVPLSKRVSLFAKLGYASWESEIRAPEQGEGAFLGAFEREDALYGGGIRIFFPGPLAVFVEYENVTDIFEIFSVGATLGF